MPSVFRAPSLAALAIAFEACGNPFALPSQLPFLANVNGAQSPSGGVGSKILLSGYTFRDVKGSSEVLFTDANGIPNVASPITFAADWADTYILATVPTGSVTGFVVVRTAAGTSVGKPFAVQGAIPTAPLTPSAVSWTQSGSSLATAVSGNAVAFAQLALSGTADTEFVYSAGGADNAGNPTTGVYSAGVATNGTLQAWTSTGSGLPALAYAAAVAATPRNSYVQQTGYLYVLGGVNASGQTVAPIYSAPLNANGTVGAFTQSAVSLPAPLRSFGAMVYLGSLYVVGGATTGNTAVATVYRSPIGVDGTLGAWKVQTGSLPGPRARLGIGAFGLYLYAVGGDSAALSPTDTGTTKSSSALFFGRLDPSTHEVASWTSTGALDVPRSAHSVVISGGNILVTGGLYAGALTGTREASYAAINADGTVGAFAAATGTNTIRLLCSCSVFNHGATGYLAGNGSFHVLVAGGDNVNAPGVKRTGAFTY